MFTRGTTFAVATAAVLAACGGMVGKDETPLTEGALDAVGGGGTVDVDAGTTSGVGGTGDSGAWGGNTGGARATVGAPGSAGAGGELPVCGPEGPSCSDMSGTECNGESCCTNILVPGGRFAMGRGTEACSGCTDGCPSGMSCYSDEQPEHTATVSSFALDKYEVTVGRFRAFVDAHDLGWRPSEGEGANAAVEAAQALAAGATGWQVAWNTPTDEDWSAPRDHESVTWTSSAGTSEQYPMNCVTWLDAFAFCIWDGGRLPTEAEWGYAAAGGDENRVYPWGNDVTEPLPANYAGNGSSPFIAVGSYPGGNGRWGHADLAGSMWEWVLDSYSSDWYTTTQTGCSDCVSLSDIRSHQRVGRGGSWGTNPDYVRVASRYGYSPVYSPYYSIGWRCARTP